MSALEKTELASLTGDSESVESAADVLVLSLHPLVLSAEALAKLSDLGVVIPEEMWAISSDGEAEVTSDANEVVDIAKYRESRAQTSEPRLETPPEDDEDVEVESTPATEIETFEPTEASLVYEATAEQSETEWEDELEESEEVWAVVDRGYASLEEIKLLAEELDIDTKVLTQHLAARGVDIELEVIDSDQKPKISPEVRAILKKSETYSRDPLNLFMNEAGKYRLLTAAEEVVLAKRIEGGDLAAKKLMINSNLRLVISIAKHYQGHQVSLMDLVQDGVLGLNRAAEKFDWRKGYKFSTYATWWIRQACQRSIANTSTTIRIPVHVQERRIKINRETARFLAREGREPTREELAQATKLKLDHVHEALDAAVSVSLNKGLDDSEHELGDLLPDHSMSDPSDDAEVSIYHGLVREAVANLPTERDRRIIELRFGFDGESQSLETIGRELGLTRERVRQLEYQALRRVQQFLEDKLPLEARRDIPITRFGRI